MCFSWMSENTPFWTDAKKSRFLICLLPVDSYYIEGQVNVTVQEVMKHVAASLNEWHEHGVQNLYSRFCSLKGDWKWLEQCLNLQRKPSKDEICFLCMATKSMTRPMTDIGPSACWKHDVAPKPWNVEPQICQVKGFSLSLVSLDIMHIWHLGFGRDLASSILLILLRSHVFHGSNATRLQEQLCIMCDVVDKFLLCVVVLTTVSICKCISCTYIYIFLYIYIYTSFSLCRLLS